MIIQKIFAQEIFNAQGLPTIQCTLELQNGQVIKSSIPSGFAQLEHAATYVYDTDNRIIQQRMLKSIDFINTTIVPMLIRQPMNVLAMDSLLMDLQHNFPEQIIGSNATLVISIALFKAQAAAEGIELFQLIQSISGTETIKIPNPLTSLFECRTEQVKSEFQEILAMPQLTHSFEQSLHAAILLHHHTKKLLETKQLPTTTGQYGSFIPTNLDNTQLFSMIDEVVATIPHCSYNFGLNINADDLYDAATNTYAWNQQRLTADNLIKEYELLLQQYPQINYIQDPMAQQDSQGWKDITAQMSAKTVVAANAVFACNPRKIRWGILQKISSMVIIKPEYVGTISQTIAAIDACKNHNKLFCIAGDTMGTHDTFISDLAVGTGATFLKAGAPFGSEHMNKYNRLLEIERFLLYQK